MSRLVIPSFVTVTLAGCTCFSSLTPCPSAADVEKSYALTTTCGGGGATKFRLRDFSATHTMDCQSLGCISMAMAWIEPTDGGRPVNGSYVSYCGSDRGRIWLAIDSDGGEVTCQALFDHLGEDVPCGTSDDAGVCSARVVFDTGN
jgi:hypothetical protein